MFHSLSPSTCFQYNHTTETLCSVSTLPCACLTFLLATTCRVHLQEQQDTPSSAAAASSSSSKQQPQYQQKQQQHKSSAAAATTQPPPPTRSQVSDLLYNKWLLDVPKMLDLAVLYAPGSSQLVQELLHQLLMLQPKYAQVRAQG